MTDELVKCPNNCIDGMIKSYPVYNRALYDTVKCPYCKGNGNVHPKQAELINKQL